MTDGIGTITEKIDFVVLLGRIRVVPVILVVTDTALRPGMTVTIVLIRNPTAREIMITHPMAHQVGTLIGNSNVAEDRLEMARFPPAIALRRWNLFHRLTTSVEDRLLVDATKVVSRSVTMGDTMMQAVLPRRDLENSTTAIVAPTMIIRNFVIRITTVLRSRGYRDRERGRNYESYDYGYYAEQRSRSPRSVSGYNGRP
uniref:Uncharacterized protein n=1 Tax=Schistocephalus solidus TaxID=70667 RepID=A0A0X3PEF1_SCHSO